LQNDPEKQDKAKQVIITIILLIITYLALSAAIFIFSNSDRRSFAFAAPTILNELPASFRFSPSIFILCTALEAQLPPPRP